MINVTPIRAEVRATAGDIVGLDKAQLDQLLDEIEVGQSALRELNILKAMPGGYAGAGIGRVSDPD